MDGVTSGFETSLGLTFTTTELSASKRNLISSSLSEAESISILSTEPGVTNSKDCFHFVSLDAAEVSIRELPACLSSFLVDGPLSLLDLLLLLFSRFLELLLISGLAVDLDAPNLFSVLGGDFLLILKVL